jgi:tight adherence protein B
MTVSILPMLTFLAVALPVAGLLSFVSDLVLRDRSRTEQRMDDEFRSLRRAEATRSMLFKNLGQAAESVAQGSHASLRHKFQDLVEQSGLALTVGRLLAIAAMTSGGAGLFVGVARRNPLLGLGAAALGFYLPILVVQFKRDMRHEKLRSQLMDAFELMARVLRAGQTMHQAILAVAEEFENPLASEFADCFEQQNLGMSPEESYRDLARRTGVVEIRIFVMTLMVQQQTGGNLAEMLDRLAVMLRERAKTKGAIKTLTAEGRMQAIILMALPPGLFMVMLVLNPDYATQLFEYPKVIIGTLIFEGLGGLWIRKIVNFDF